MLLDFLFSATIVFLYSSAYPLEIILLHQSEEEEVVAIVLYVMKSNDIPAMIAVQS